jgi:hypothetical protein
LFEQSLSGSSGDSASGGAEAGESGGVELGGYVRGDFFAGQVPDSKRWEMKAGYGEVSLKLGYKHGSSGSAFAEPRFRYGQQGPEKRLFVDLREAYVNGYFGPLDIRLGQQIIVWGRADALNPTNNLTPVDLRVRSPNEDDRRVGNVGARMFLNFDPFRLEGVWMPLYRPAELPITLPEYVQLSDDHLPSPQLQNSTQGARLHLELPSVDMSVSYVYGFAPLPGLVFDRIQWDSYQPIVLNRRTYKHHVVGFDFATSIGEELGIRGEAAFRNPLHYKRWIFTPKPDIQYVVGLDRNFGSISVIVQYMGRTAFDWVKRYPGVLPSGTDPRLFRTYDPASPMAVEIDEEVRAYLETELAQKNQLIFSQTEKQQHLVSARIEWKTLHDTLSVSALGLVNVSTEEWLVFPKIAYQISDALSASVGAEILRGPDDTLFGFIDEQLSAGYAELKASF